MVTVNIFIKSPTLKIKRGRTPYHPCQRATNHKKSSYSFDEQLYPNG